MCQHGGDNLAYRAAGNGTHGATEMPYNSETETFYQAPATVVDSTPDGDTVQEGFDDRLTPALAGVYADFNLLKADGMISVGIPATTTARGIGRVAAVADEDTIVNGPAFLAAGTDGALKQAVRAKYMTTGNFDLVNPGTYICDNTAGGITNAPPNFSSVFVYTKEWVPSGGSVILYDEARSFDGNVRVAHRTFVPSRGTWSEWVEASGIASYSKVLRATNVLDGRLTFQAASGYNNVTLWPSGGKLMITRNTGDTTTENESMYLNPVDGTINGVLPAPRPTSANFVGCGSTLPAGGTWAYCVNSWNSTGYYIQTYSGVAAGGKTIAVGATYINGFAWRVA